MPSLPVPPLSSTKSKLLEWVEPLVTKEQFQKTSNVIERFFEENGEAVKLQTKLYEWDQSRTGSWLKPFWVNSYLEHRDHLPYSMNFNILLKNDHYKNRFTIAEMAGQVSFLAAELYHAIIDGDVEQDAVKGKLLDMSQYKYFFRSVRIPKLERDTFYVADFNKKNNHVIILYKNNVYKVQVTNHVGAIYQSHQIAAAIETEILADQDEGINVGIFTTAKRDKAAKAYEMLSTSKLNAEILQAIADSIVIISIDEDSKDSEEAIKNLMLNANNKYFDKTIQMIITKQHELGFNIEHSTVDGTSIAAVISHISKGLKKDFHQAGQTFEIPIVEKRTWELKQESLAMLNQFHDDHLRQKDNYHLQSRVFTDFGAGEIKRMNFSPDAFLHMALQIAQYRTYGRFESVYEPVSVRFFYEGRTECARATSMEKRRLVEAMDHGGESKKVLYSLMQRASAAHSDRIRDCQKGYGVERHMYGLEQMYHLFGPELGLEELPEIFKDEGYLTMRRDFISTSGMAYENVKYRMFGPVVEDGHGMAYIILEDSISINISSYTENKIKGNQLMEHLLQALNELRMIGAKDL
ncbi:choline/carnitine O-acyltransferase [Siminovitchia acidinfaciens]|uniref:choline/carnitine O-acyltransferase n=1 Tax=Siminovitchia acidinfaciens TaxID=2321395 RepID=UPI0013DEA176|nr:choline/carnitine O-acyltransferase [Siminovitchia acidinfaciens]